MDDRDEAGSELAGDFDTAAPSPWMAAIVLALAAGLVCLPGAVALAEAGVPPAAALGLGFVGMSLACVKGVSMIFGICSFAVRL